ncbi:cytochrome P450 [Williamsia herbipolensis]|uniref:cytochrome P450 n=1 Tax=Williamsia herbipolensis TaxID=1603258 RepID=UPI00193931DD|nr:cytochrome P450 [Williamsia herbipolensis]
MTGGEPVSDYFRRSGISALAEASGGMCTFWMGSRLALYQITNTPLVIDAVLAPSTEANRELFGDFMGSMPHDHPGRPARRIAVERSLGNAKFVANLEPAIRQNTATFLQQQTGRKNSLEDFTLSLTAYVDSMIPGVLDLSQHPITSYLKSEQYGPVVRGFFDLASDVISNDNPDAMKEFDVIVPFVRQLLLENLAPLMKAPAANMIRRYFDLWGLALDRTNIEALDSSKLKELGTIIIATYDTSALSLMWAIAYIESTPQVKGEIIAQARSDVAQEKGPGGDATLSVIDLAVLEAVRLGGSNPSALWRRTTEPVTISFRDSAVTIPPDTMLWLDRRQANRDPAIFPEPAAFSPANIRSIYRSERETLSSLLSRSRYEINSFSMINAERNPRKCPGRLFSVRMQSIVLSELYGDYRVITNGHNLDLKPYASMPRPTQPGTVEILPINKERSIDRFNFPGHTKKGRTTPGNA